MKNTQGMEFEANARRYLNNLGDIFTKDILNKTETLCQYLYDAWREGRQVFICGNGGSAANAIHIANDFHYGIGACGQSPVVPGMRVDALPANSAIITCLANDTGYENIYSNQLVTRGHEGDILIALSGSGNSSNIINAITAAKSLRMKSAAILAFDGGVCKGLADLSIHFEINDMQIAEDTQLIIGHLCMQWLASKKPKS